MFDLNWIDLVVILLVLFSAVAGFKIGIAHLFFVLIGFFSTLYIAGKLLPAIIPIEDRTILTIVASNVILLTALAGGYVGFGASKHVHLSLKEGPKLEKLDAIVGVFAGAACCILLVWLVIATIVRLPFESFSNHVSAARTTVYLNKVNPSLPLIFTVGDDDVNPNKPPFIFEESDPEHKYAFSKADYERAQSAAKESVVEITGFGCGGVVTGTGFATSNNKIVTNAHVIAGVKRPIVKYKGLSYEAVPVYFNANKDFAILSLEFSDIKFNATPLKLTDKWVIPDITVAIAGFPDGKYTVQPGIIRESTKLNGRNIYDLGVISKDVYLVQSYLTDGSSGSPVINSEGLAVGIVMSKISSSEDYSHILASPQLINIVEDKSDSKSRVSTGVCAAN